MDGFDLASFVALFPLMLSIRTELLLPIRIGMRIRRRVGHARIGAST